MDQRKFVLQQRYSLAGWGRMAFPFPSAIFTRYRLSDMHKLLTIALFASCLSADALPVPPTRLGVERLRCQDKPAPRGIDALHPGLSWELTSGERGVRQTAYEVRVGTGTTHSEVSALVWSSGKVLSEASVGVPYAGAALSSGTVYYWQVRVWDNKGNASAWSTPALFETGLLQKTDWKAQWIEPGYTEDDVQRQSPLLRKEFQTGKKVRSATAFITAHGLYEASINGVRVGDACLTPGWTSYNKRLQYQEYDVTNLLRQGRNAVGVMLGSGWYRGFLAWEHTHNIWGSKLGLLFQLTVTYTDGSTETIASDDSWKSSTGSVISSEIYHGETIDHRLEKKGWTSPGYDDAAWSGVKTVSSYGYDNLVSTENEPIRKHEILHPVKIFTTPKGEQIIDFGQNMVGWVVVKATGKAGDRISLHHAEVLDKEGNFYTTNLRVAKQNDVYILDGNGEETFEPHFTFQGFRYVRVEGYPGVLKPEDFTAVALYSDMEQTGTFSCSNAMINQLQHNITWGQRGNFLDVPTDCPQRDERLGWTGDAQVFSRTAAFNRDVHNFFSKWLKDVAADQFSSGAVPHVVPNVLGPNDGGSAGWSDVSTIVPWNMYLAYADTDVLRNQYASMRAWVEYMHHSSKDNLWNTGGHFGDWLSYMPAGGDASTLVTDTYLIAQCFYAHSTQLLIDAATVLGKTDDVQTYTALLKDVKDAFMREYVTPGGRMISSTQTAYVLALEFDMLPESLRAEATRRLVDNIHLYKDHLTTGFLGTPYLCHVLSRFGQTPLAYTLLLQDTYPSWLYPVRMGATTIWERWDGLKPDGTFEDAGMNSFNHYAYGAIGDWMYRVAAGIDTDPNAPGYKAITIKPHPGGNMTDMRATLLTNYGETGSHWSTADGRFTLEVTVPVNTSATVYVPAGSVDSVQESGQALSADKDLSVSGVEDGYVVVKVGSGHYTFTAPK